MKNLIFALLLVAFTISQPGTLFTDTVVRTVAPEAAVFRTSSAGAAADTPSASLAMDTSSSDSAKIGSSSSTGTTKMAMISTSSSSSGSAAGYITSGNNGFNNANNAWSYLQNLGGGCCNNCNKICGLAIKLYGTNYYLTKVSAWFQFLSTSSPNANQIFTLGQNADCTWSISNGGSYLSTTSIYSGSWVGPASSIGAN